ncbi:MAG: hypothetical protein ACRC6X_03285 [Culicoidibacterales bacterium]
MEKTEPINATRTRKKKPKRKAPKIIILLIILISIGVGLFYGVSFLLNQSVETTPPDQTQTTAIVEPVGREYTTFQERKNQEYLDQRVNFVGDSSEVALVAQKFAMDLFTVWGTKSVDDYGGKEFIPENNSGDFDKNVKNTFYFRYDDTVKRYEAENLPIVVEVTVGEPKSRSVGYEGVGGYKTYDGYAVSLELKYQDGNIEGTKNKDIQKANELLAQWIHKVKTAEFFFIPGAESGTPGTWYLSEMNNLTSEIATVE